MVAPKALAALLLALVILPASVYGAHGLVTSSLRTEVNTGQRATFTINVTNTAGDNVTRMVTDFNGFLFAGASCPSGFSQSNTASVLTCSGGLLQNLTSAFVNIDLTAPSSAGAYYFTTTTTDNNGGTSSSVIGIAVKTPASLSVTPSFASKKVSAGSAFTLSATLNDAGQTNVTSPSITIGLPSGYALGQDETQFTKVAGAGSSVSWNINAPSTADSVDRTITLTPAGNDFNTGAPAVATAASVTVRATAMSLTAVVDKAAAVGGEGVTISGYAKEGDTPLKTAYVILQPSFGNRQTTYTDTSGHYSFRVFMPQASGEYGLDVSATYGDLSGSASAITVMVGELFVNAAVSPASVNKGENTTIRGKVWLSGAPIGGAEIRTKVGGAKTYLTVSDRFGAFSQSVAATAAGTMRLEVTATTNDGKTGTAILLLNVAGKANKSIEVTAPPAVNPSQNFTVSGRLLSDGAGANGTVEVTFAEVSRSLDIPDNGEFSISLAAPNKEGCYDLTAKSSGAETVTRKICAYSHTDIKISISAKSVETGPNVVTITALYEDGTPVTGSLTYGIDATQYVSNISAGAKLVDATFQKSGKYFVSAYVDDGVRQKMFSKSIAIGNVTTTAGPTATATPIPTTTATPVPTVTATANATALPSPEATTRTNLALLLVGGIIILLLFF